MARLKFYENERIMLDKLGFKPRNNRITEKKHILLVIKKLCKHFKFDLPDVRFYGNSDSGSAKVKSRVIRLDHNPSYQVVIHELAHIYNHDNDLDGEKCHTKKLMKTIKKFAKYIMKKQYWVKPEPEPVNP